MNPRLLRQLMIGIAGAFFLTVALSGCGGGGGDGLRRPVDPAPDLRLPSGHGLEAGVITVVAGTSEEHGNVVVTCPPEGSACVVTVLAAGTAVYERTGGVPSVMAAYDSLGLPSGHGLGAGVITVAAGTSEEHGNVVVTCPPGGSACMVKVSADGTAEYARTGSIPAFMFRQTTPAFESTSTFERDNPTAEDLLDHWNEPEQLRMALGLSAVAAVDIAGRREALADLIKAAGGASGGTGTRLRNVQPNSIEIIGERNGITYGRWTGGPAGTLNIEFDWRFTPNLDAETRAMFERAGKSWSWRLADQFGLHTIERGTDVSLPDRPRLTLFEDVTTDGLVIFMDHYDETTESRGRHLEASRSALRENDFEPFLGTILLAQSRIDEVPTRGSARLISLMAHEIAHVIGISKRLGDMADFADFYDSLVDDVNHTFTGPNAVAANGGKPVPFQWQIGRNRVPPFTPEGVVNRGHLDVSDSITSYRRRHVDRFEPSELDFAFLKDIGYEVLDAETSEQPEVYGFGAWGRYSGWGTAVARTINHDVEGNDVVTEDRLHASADVFGVAPAANLGEIRTSMQGNVSWSGSLLGVDLGRPMLPPVFGDAVLHVDLSSLRGTAVFDGLTTHVSGESSAFRSPRLEYAIGVAGNSFSDDDDHVRGGFFGPAHEEMAGVLDDRTDAVNLMAGFGGRR